MPINNVFFKNRSITLYDVDQDEVISKVTIPDNRIYCDLCNVNIAANKPKKIPLFCRINRDKGTVGITWALCQKCVKRKPYRDIICIGNSKLT